jgi:hypothetical protein
MQIQYAGKDAVILAQYLLQSPHSNAIGLYRLPLDYIAIDCPVLSPTDIAAAMEALENLGFCSYDHRKQVIWVVNMAEFQHRKPLVPTDLKVKGIKSELRALPRTYLIQQFWKRHEKHLSLGDWEQQKWPLEGPSKPLRSPFQAPTEAPCEGASLEREKERETEKEKEITEFLPSTQGIGGAVEALYSAPGDNSASELGISSASALRNLSEEAQKKKLWKRIRAVERNDAWRKWWLELLARIWENDKALSDFYDVLKHVEDSLNERVREAKGHGEPHSPDRLLVSKVKTVCKKHKIRWPDHPANSAA